MGGFSAVYRWCFVQLNLDLVRCIVGGFAQLNRVFMRIGSILLRLLDGMAILGSGYSGYIEN